MYCACDVGVKFWKNQHQKLSYEKKANFHENQFSRNKIVIESSLKNKVRLLS